MPPLTEFEVQPDDDGKRLDRIVRRLLPNTPLGAISKMIRTGRIRLNGRRVSHGARVHEGDTVGVPAETVQTELPEPLSRTSRSKASGRRQTSNLVFHVPVLDRTDDVLVINKPPGLAAHGPKSVGTAVESVAFDRGWVKPSLAFRPGPTHRLDRNTSGVQSYALTITGARSMSRAFRDHIVSKVYLAVADGLVQGEMETERSISYDSTTQTADVGDGKPASSRVVPIAYSQRSDVSLVAISTQTGRTHQVRAHLADMGHAVAGDGKYGGGGSIYLRTDTRASFLSHSAERPVEHQTTERSIPLEVPVFPAPPTYVLHAWMLNVPNVGCWFAPLYSQAQTLMYALFADVDSAIDAFVRGQAVHCPEAFGNSMMHI